MAAAASGKGDCGFPFVFVLPIVVVVVGGGGGAAADDDDGDCEFCFVCLLL